MLDKKKSPAAGANKANQTNQSNNITKGATGYFKNYCHECGMPFDVRVGEDYKSRCYQCWYKSCSIRRPAKSRGQNENI